MFVCPGSATQRCYGTVFTPRERLGLDGVSGEKWYVCLDCKRAVTFNGTEWVEVVE